MDFPRRLFLTVGGTLAAALGGAYLIGASGDARIWLPLGLSIASLAVSILAAFRSELFSFAPRLVGGDLLLAQTQPPTANFNLVLPLHFTNTGYADGVVEWVAVRIRPESAVSPLLLTPVAEIDIQRFIQGRRHLHAESTIGPFASFPLAGKASVAKSILFSFEAKPGAPPPPPLQPGKHRFDVYVKAGHANKPRLALSFTHPFTQQMIDDYRRGSSIHNVQRDIAALLP